MSAANEPDAESLPALDVSAAPGQSEGQWVVQLRGEVDVATSPLLRAELNKLVDGDARSLVLDLAALKFIDSSGLGVLVEAQDRLKERDGETLVLRDVQEPVRRVFEITGLTELFTIEG
jgi:anti-sigma B factor antagonist